MKLTYARGQFGAGLELSKNHFFFIKPFYFLPSTKFQKSAEGYPPVVLLLLNKKSQQMAHQEYLKK